MRLLFSLRTIVKKVNYLLDETEKRNYLILFLGMFIVAAFEIVGIGALPLFIGVLTKPEIYLDSIYVEVINRYIDLQTPADLLYLGGGLLFAANITKNIVTFLFYKFEAGLLYDSYSKMSTILFDGYMKAPYSFHLRRNSSEIIRNTYIETKYIVTSTMVSLLGIMFNLIVVTSIFFFLVYLYPLVTISLTLSLGISSLIGLSKLRNATEYYGNLAQRNRGKIIGHVQMSVGAIKFLLISNRQDTLVKNYELLVKDFSNTFKFSKVLSKATKPFVEALTITILLSTAFILSWFDFTFSTILTVLTLFASASIRLIPSIREILSYVTDLNYHKNSLDPVVNDLKEINGLTKHKEVNKGIDKSFKFNNRIELKNLSFQYDTGKSDVLSNVNLVIEKGQHVGIVGASGSGKSSLIDVILGLLQPSEGDVLVDGENINSNLAGWTSLIGYIPQDNYICDDTLKQNVALGIDDKCIDDDRFWKSIEGAQLKSVIETSPNGVNTLLGERGANLSGGQRQRIGIARAIYGDPEIIIMDEATSALDNSTEKAFLDALDDIGKNKTLITVAHRLSTIKDCDIIYFMEDGQIKASGSFSKLLSDSDGFRKMSKLETN